MLVGWFIGDQEREIALSSSLWPVLARNVNIKKKKKKLNNTNTKDPQSMDWIHQIQVSKMSFIYFVVVVVIRCNKERT